MRILLNQAYDSSISQKFISQIYSKMYALKILPHRCEEFWAWYRVFTINKQYRVIFRVDEENKQIIVVNIFSCSQDYNDIF